MVIVEILSLPLEGMKDEVAHCEVAGDEEVAQYKMAGIIQGCTVQGGRGREGGRGQGIGWGQGGGKGQGGQGGQSYNGGDDYDIDFGEHRKGFGGLGCFERHGHGSGFCFLTEPDDALKCLICLGIAKKPRQHSKCGKLFCKDCIERYGKEKACPHCKREQPQYFGDTRSK